MCFTQHPPACLSTRLWPRTSSKALLRIPNHHDWSKGYKKVHKTFTEGQPLLEFRFKDTGYLTILSLTEVLELLSATLWLPQRALIYCLGDLFITLEQKACTRKDNMPALAMPQPLSIRPKPLDPSQNVKTKHIKRLEKENLTNWWLSEFSSSLI